MTLPRSLSFPGARVVRRLAGVGAVCATVVLAGCGSDGDAGGYQVRAIFDSASFVQNGLDVRIAGVTVGAVDDVELTDDNRAAVTFTITDAGFQDFRRDARCTIRPQALIGERYIECELTAVRPEGATAPPELTRIADGPYEGQYLLPVDRTAVPVDSDQLLNVNDATTRDRFGMIIRELGAGVAGRGDEIANSLRKGNEGLLYTNRLLKQLSDETEMLKNLTSTSDQTLAVLAAERDSLSGFVDNGATVANRLAARKNEVKGTIAALSDAIKEVSPSVDRVTELTDELQPIADDLNRSSTDLSTVFNLLPELSERGSTAVKALSPTIQRGTEVLTSDTTNTLFERLTRTSNAVKASASVLGLTLGDFRSTGGLDYFLDAIYGLAYATNGRDAAGSYLRGTTLNALACAIPESVTQSSACGTRLQNEIGGVGSAPTSTDDTDPQPEAARARAASTGSAEIRPSASAAPKKTSAAPKATTPTTPSAESAAAELLLGGSQ